MKDKTSNKNKFIHICLCTYTREYKIIKMLCTMLYTVAYYNIKQSLLS